MNCKLFDTHTHFNFNAFKDDWEEVIGRTLAQDIWFINVGAEAKTSQRAVAIAKKYPFTRRSLLDRRSLNEGGGKGGQGVFAAVGLHPIHVYDDEYEEEVNGERVRFITRAEEFDKDFYTGLIKKSKKVVAVGETGLDYFHIKKFSSVLNKKLKAKQAEVFIEQIRLAKKYKKPVIIHCRPDKDFDAYKDILEILKDNKSLTGIVHCFQADKKILEQFLNFGFMIGYNGVITFTEQYNGLVKATSLERIVLETDAPWLAPVPYRGKRNESIYVTEVARRIAELKNISYKEVAEVTTENAMRIFRLSD
ncbi:MAG: TatD family hydrolase [Candidatus Moraniibacteriota bacterium]